MIIFLLFLLYLCRVYFCFILFLPEVFTINSCILPIKRKFIIIIINIIDTPNLPQEKMYLHFSTSNQKL